MIKLEKYGYKKIYGLYLTSDLFFPLIAAVLLDEQDGVVYVNDPISPSQVYVEHAFGFAQIIGETDSRFEQELARYLLSDKRFNPGKIRLYASYLPEFIALLEHESLRSYRQRFIIGSVGFPHGQENCCKLEKNFTLGGVDAGNISLIENQFGVVDRFWRSPDDFILRANAIVVCCDGAPASICYSAAEADHRIEIDVLTLPKYRNQGLAKIAVINFINRCLRLSQSPLWDCFINNAGSMMLSKSVGFIAYRDPYPFFTINK